MKNIKIVAGFLILLFAVGFACKPFNLNQDDLNLTLNLDIIKTNIGIDFLDAMSKAVIGSNDEMKAKVTIYGTDANWVLDPSGERYTEYLSSSGYVGLALDPYNAKPTADQQVKFVAVVDLDGYVSTSIPIKLNSEGIHEYVVELVSLVNPPDGVTVTQKDHVGSAANGVVDKDIDVSTENNEATITINKGTTLFDIDGVALEGDLKVDLVYFDPTNEEALGVFPGGMNVTVKNESGVEEDISFISAGFVALDVKDASGRKASNIGKDQIMIDVAIPQGYINPETAVPVKAGDKIPLWSYENYDGEWKYEGEITVKGEPGMLSASFSLPHLSYWNLDWKAENCDNKYLFFDGNTAITARSKYKVRARLVTGSGYLYSSYQWLYPGQNIRMVNIPMAPIEIYFQDYYHVCGITPQWQRPADFIWDFCENGDYTSQLTANQIYSVYVEILIHWNDTNQDISPTQAIKGRFRQQGKDCWTTVWIHNGGESVGGIEPNTTYEIQAYYQGKWQPDSPHVQSIGTETTVVFHPSINCN